MYHFSKNPIISPIQTQCFFHWCNREIKMTFRVFFLQGMKLRPAEKRGDNFTMTITNLQQ